MNILSKYLLDIKSVTVPMLLYINKIKKPKFITLALNVGSGSFSTS